MTAEPLPTPPPTERPEPSAVAPEPASTTPERPASISLVQGGIERAEADRIEVAVGGIGAAVADSITLRVGGIGAAKAERIEIAAGQVGAAATGTLHARVSALSLVAARHAEVERSLIQTLVAQEVRLGGRTPVLLLIAQRVEGGVRPLLDWRGALAAGAAFAALSFLLRRLGRD